MLISCAARQSVSIFLLPVNSCYITAGQRDEFGVRTVTSMKITVFYDVMACNFVGRFL